MSLMTGYDKGVRLQGPVTNLAVAGIAAAAVIFQMSNFAQLVGTKSVRIKRILMWSNASGNTTVIIGTGAGAGFAQALVPYYIISGFNLTVEEEELPETELFLDITAYPVALLVGGSIDIQLEVEEIG
jgi:predicted membrane protein